LGIIGLEQKDGVAEFGAVFSTLTSIIMPALRDCGDRWINAEKLYGYYIFKWFSYFFTSS
jgi:hypothetical protein